MSVFQEAFKVVLGHEGGYQNLHNDRGNWTSGKVGVGINKGTKYGITAMSYPNLDIKNLTLADAEKIYKQNYWDRINGDKLEPGLALAAFDTAINSGPGKAIELLNKTGNAQTFLDLRRAYIRNLNLYRTVISGNRNKKTYGEVWEERINALDKQVEQFTKQFAKIDREFTILLDEGSGTFVDITDSRFESDRIVVNLVDKKVYIRLKPL